MREPSMQLTDAYALLVATVGTFDQPETLKMVLDQSEFLEWNSFGIFTHVSTQHLSMNASTWGVDSSGG
jgi:hypothetical protein